MIRGCIANSLTVDGKEEIDGVQYNMLDCIELREIR